MTTPLGEAKDRARVFAETYGARPGDDPDAWDAMHADAMALVGIVLHELKEPGPPTLSHFTRAYLRDARDSEAIDRDTPDSIIDREAEKLDVQIYQLASSFVDNEFDEREE